MNGYEISVIIVAVCAGWCLVSVAKYFREKARTYASIHTLIAMFTKSGLVEQFFEQVKPKPIEVKIPCPDLPKHIVDGVCQKEMAVMCNLGYACDGCPYNPDNKVDLG